MLPSLPVGVGLFLVVALVRLPTFWVRMNRDAGIYAYLGQRVSQGEVLYRDLWDQHPPGIVLVNALLFTVFPDQFLTVQVFEVLVGFGQALLFYRLARLFYSPRAALLTTTLFVFFINSLRVNQGGNLSEFYAVIPAIGGMEAFVRYRAGQRPVLLFVSGMLGGLAFIFRPTGMAFLLAVGLVLGLDARRSRRLSVLTVGGGWVGLGLLAALSGLVLFLVVHGTAGDFVSQVFRYNYFYSTGFLSLATLRRLEWSLTGFAFGAFALLWVLAATTAIDLARRATPGVDGRSPVAGLDRGDRVPGPLGPVFLWAAFDAAAIAVGGRFYPHYYMQMVPSLSLLSGYTIARFVGAAGAPRSIERTLAGVACIALLGISASVQVRDTVRVVRDRIVHGQRGPEELVADYVTQHTADRAFVYVWGSDAMVNFLSRRPSPSRYSYPHAMQVPGYAEPGMVRDLLRDLERKPPEFIIDTSATNPLIPPLDPGRPRPPSREREGGGRDVYTVDMFDPVRHFAREHYVERAVIARWIIYERRERAGRQPRS